MKRTVLCEETESQRQETVMENQKQRKVVVLEGAEEQPGSPTGDKVRRNRLPEASERYDPATTMVSDVWPPELLRTYCSKPPFVVPCSGSPGKPIEASKQIVHPASAPRINGLTEPLVSVKTSFPRLLCLPYLVFAS